MSFNPTLVRLRRLPPKNERRGPIPFQSHAGSIEARFKSTVGSSMCSVSIPRWFD